MLRYLNKGRIKGLHRQSQSYLNFRKQNYYVKVKPRPPEYLNILSADFEESVCMIGLRGSGKPFVTAKEKVSRDVKLAEA